MNLAFRSLEPELMDDPDLDAAEHRQALDGLARTHVFTRTAERIWADIQTMILAPRKQTLSILDVGCGDGFLLRKINQLANRAGYSVELNGCDFSKTAVALARTISARTEDSIDFHQLDVLTDDLPPADVIVNSLFLHHFTESQVVEILRKFNTTARQSVIVQDLARTKLGYGLCLVGTRLLSRSRIVHVDGLLSVKAAFSVEEFRAMAKAAEIQQATISKHWPERISIIWQTNNESPQ